MRLEEKRDNTNAFREVNQFGTEDKECIIGGDLQRSKLRTHTDLSITIRKAEWRRPELCERILIRKGEERTRVCRSVVREMYHKMSPE